MKLLHRFTAAVLLAGAVVLATPRARALVTLEDGLDQFFVNGSYGIAYDSNVFANSTRGGSWTRSGSFGIEFVRRAGWIGVNGSMNWSLTDFVNYPAQNFLDPAMSLEFTKQTGRTTGSLVISAQRTDRADVDVNTRDTSWNYNVGLNFRYPVIERYSLAGGLTYSDVEYTDQKLFTNLATYAASLDLYYILSDARDLFGGYRYRYSQSANHTFDTDHGVHLGISGRIVPKINGSISVGYDLRTPHGDGTGQFASYTASGSATWNYNRKLSITGDISKDFALTATDTTTDATTADLALQYAMNAKVSFSAGLGGGETQFLSKIGGTQRKDWSFNANMGVNYTYNQHLTASLNYGYYRNWSTIDFATFPREQLNLNVSSRW